MNIPSLEKYTRDCYQSIINTIGSDFLDEDENFFDLGITSLEIAQITLNLSELLKSKVDIITLYRYPTFNSFISNTYEEFYGQICESIDG